MSDKTKEFGRGAEEQCVPSFFDAYAAELRRTLVPYAAEVFLLSQIGGSRRVAAHFSALLSRKISRKPVLTILAKIRSGELHVTKDEVLAAAKKHPLAERFLARAPYLADPQSNKRVIDEPAPHPKVTKRGRPRKTVLPTAKPQLSALPSGNSNGIDPAKIAKQRALLEAAKRAQGVE